MKRRLIAGMVGLALAGCAHGRSSTRPVAISSVPPLKDTINAGLPDAAPQPAAPTPPVADASAPLLLQRDSSQPGLTPADPAVQRASSEAPPPAPVESLTLPPPPALPPVTTPPAPPDAPRDPAFQPTQAVVHPAEVRSRVDSGNVIGLTVAAVGNQTISLAELQDAVREWVRTNVPKGQIIARDQVNELAANLLEQLIDRAIYIEEAERVLLKNDKQRKMFNDFIDKQWKEHEIPKLIERYKVKDELELRQQLQDENRSLEMMRERFRKDSTAKEFLQHQLHERIATPGPREIWNYYYEHIRAFDRPALITWRELTVKVSPDLNPAAARRRAEELWNRLRRGEDFATLARSSSQGPTASKGGLWQTAPGASAAPAVNEALASLPINQTSTVLEAPDGFHIIRVEGRREAGPAPYAEAQDKVRETLLDLNFQREAEAYTRRLRTHTLVTYYIKDKPRRDGQAKRTNANP